MPAGPTGLALWDWPVKVGGELAKGLPFSKDELDSPKIIFLVVL